MNITKQKRLTPPLGRLLCEADLISVSHLEVALRDQKDYSDLRLGEILTLRGWLKAKTVSFLIHEYPELLAQDRKLLIGECLSKAGLLTEEQIEELLIEQKWREARFGKLVVQYGWLKPKTVDFFANSLTQPVKPVEKVKSDLLKEIEAVLKSCQLNRKQCYIFKDFLGNHRDLDTEEVAGLRKIQDHLTQGRITIVD